MAKGPGPEFMTPTPLYTHELFSVHVTGPLVMTVYMYSNSELAHSIRSQPPPKTEWPS